jgi:hypothetical protein
MRLNSNEEKRERRLVGAPVNSGRTDEGNDQKIVIERGEDNGVCRRRPQRWKVIAFACRAVTYMPVHLRIGARGGKLVCAVLETSTSFLDLVRERPEGLVN